MFGPVTTAIRPPSVAAKITVIRGEGLALRLQRSFDDGMAPADNLEIERGVDHGPRPAALLCDFGERGVEIEPREGLGETPQVFARARRRSATSASKIASSRASARSAAEAIFASSSTSSRVEKRIASAMV